jgi:hypothetical protein
MATLIEDTKGKIRDLPIAPTLRQILLAAATVAGIDQVRVTSGGQAKLGTPGKRTGSTRHDLGNAADLMLEKDGRALAFTLAADLPIFENFVTAAAAKGATGIGAGIDYMGPRTLHVGFGSVACWGAGGKQVNAPPWLRRAFVAGRTHHDDGTEPPAPPPVAPLDAADNASAPRPYVVVARSGLRLRSGPGTEFGSNAVLPSGTRLGAVIDTAHPNWARVDLQQDGLFDGYVFASYIAPA